MDEATSAQVRDLVTKGAMGGWLCITTNDAHGTLATLKDRGVDVTDEPSPKPYGIDFGHGHATALVGYTLAKDAD